jgi:hypothetical protein
MSKIMFKRNQSNRHVVCVTPRLDYLVSLGSRDESINAARSWSHM